MTAGLRIRNLVRAASRRRPSAEASADHEDSATGPPQWPNLIIAGSQKSGTTWLHRALAEHPDVHMSSPKELYFFGKPEVAEESRRDWYRDHFRSTARFRGESSSNYFWQRDGSEFSPPPAQRDAAHDMSLLLGEDLVVFVLLRSPVERAIASANHQVTMQRIAADADIFSSKKELGLIDLGFFGRHLTHWIGVLDDRVSPLFFDDLRKDSSAFLDRVLNRLDLDREAFDPDLLAELLEPSHTREEIREHRSWDPATQTFQVRESDVHRLVEIYREDISVVERLLGRALPAWVDVESLSERLVNTV